MLFRHILAQISFLEKSVRTGDREGDPNKRSGPGGETVTAPEHYRQCALACIKEANSVSSLTVKAMFLEMAQTWLKLAEQADAFRNRPYARHLMLDGLKQSA